jgi:hypothetical protein
MSKNPTFCKDWVSCLIINQRGEREPALYLQEKNHGQTAVTLTLPLHSSTKEIPPKHILLTLGRRYKKLQMPG